MAVLDILLIVLYFAGVAAIGWWSSRHSSDNSRDYFLAGGGVGWVAIGASLFASNISAEHFIGLAGSGASSGLAVGQFELTACICLMLLGWLFAPLYLRTGVFTMPEFLELRYNSASRTYFSAISIVAYVFTKVSVAVYAGAVVLETILGWNIWVGAVVLLVATGLYTAFGGLRAVVYTDFFQAFILIAGGIFLTVAALNRIGGLTALTEAVPPDFFNLWRGMDHPDFPWTGLVVGATILGIWYWCTDQMIVQRTLAARGIDDARKATLLAGFLKLLPIFILVLPGLIGYAIFPDTQPNRMYARMVDELLPVGVKGLVVAALLAALMSSLSSVFNSASSIATMDFYKRLRPDATEHELVRFGKFATFLLVIVGLLWLPFIGIMSNQLYVYLQSVQAYIAPPIAATFLVGIVWKRATGTAAITTLLSGFAVGATRFIIEIGWKAGWIEWAPAVAFASINFLHLAIFIFILSVGIMVSISLATAPPSEANLQMFRVDQTVHDGAKSGLRTDDQLRVGASTMSIWLTVLLMLCVGGIWVIFSPLVF
jgi:solute:Na+ symporter, SSS family